MLIWSLNRCASLQQANEFKDQKVNVRAEVRKHINDLISLLKNVGVSDAISNITSNSLHDVGHRGREGSVLGEFSMKNIVTTSNSSGLGQSGLSSAKSSRVTACNSHLLSSRDDVFPLVSWKLGFWKIECIIHSKPSSGLLASRTSWSLGSLPAFPSVQQLSDRSSESFLTQRPTVSFRLHSISATFHPFHTHSFGSQTSKVGSSSAYLFGSDLQRFVQRSHSLSRPFERFSDRLWFRLLE